MNEPDYCIICEREFPAGTLAAWDGDVCPECDEEHEHEVELAAANDATAPAAEPVVKPIVIGQDAPAPAEPKRGWWRRAQPR